MSNDKKTEDKISFWLPADISKAKNAKGEIEMKVSGIASTIDEDTDGENLNPKGFDLDYFKTKGFLNWHHKSSSDPSAIIGEPTDAKITKKGLYIEGVLYPESETAVKVYKLADLLQKSSENRRLGFSIEGKVIERDPLNPKIITKAKITGCAITHMPKNSNTFLEIVKGEYEELSPELEFDEKVSTENVDFLTKSEVYEKLFSDFSGISNQEAKQIYNKIINIMKKSQKTVAKVTSEDIEKAYDVLGLFTEEEIIKGEDEEEFEEEEFEEEETTEEEEETSEEQEIEKGGYKKKIAKKVEEEEEEETEEEEEEESEPVMKKGKMIKKSIQDEDLLKAIEFQSVETTTMFKALGKILKGIEQKMSLLDERIDDIQTAPMPSKTVTKTYSKRLEKSLEDELTDGVVLSCKSNRKEVLEVLDKAAFEKGYDPEFGKAMTQFEAGAGISREVVQKIKQRYNVQITS